MKVLILVVFLLFVLSIPALGIPPTPPYKALADRSEKEGVAAVRGEFRSAVEDLTAGMDKRG